MILLFSNLLGYKKGPQILEELKEDIQLWISRIAEETACQFASDMKKWANSLTGNRGAHLKYLIKHHVYGVLLMNFLHKDKSIMLKILAASLLEQSVSARQVNTISILSSENWRKTQKLEDESRWRYSSSIS